MIWQRIVLFFIIFSLQCVRGSGKQHPTKDLRHWPLKFAVEGVLKLAKVIVFDSRTLAYEVPRKYCYCEKTDDGTLMFQCEQCGVYYHAHCVGLKEGDLKDEDYVCGYCQEDPDDDGIAVWKGQLSMPEGYQRWPKPKRRNIEEYMAHLDKLGDADKEWQGPRTWNEARQLVKDRRVVLRGKEEEIYRKALEKQKEGGHHIMDMVVGGHVVDAPLSEEQIDFLEGNGLLN